MTFDYELDLISATNTQSELGDPIPNETRITVLCDVLSVTRSEYYAAASHNLRPEIVFSVNMYDYEKQSLVEFEGIKYNVIRTYKSNESKGIGDFETIELVCQGVK